MKKATIHLVIATSVFMSDVKFNKCFYVVPFSIFIEFITNNSMISNKDFARKVAIHIFIVKI
jgi:hypothetical protein